MFLFSFSDDGTLAVCHTATTPFYDADKREDCLPYGPHDTDDDDDDDDSDDSSLLSGLFGWLRNILGIFTDMFNSKKN